MKKYASYMILALFLSSCATVPFPVNKPWGGTAPYGEGIHPGIDFGISAGTPIIAVSSGIVTHVGEPCPNERYCGGFSVNVRHGNYFKSLYMHLSKVYVRQNESVKRGQLIGLSGFDNGQYAHLHFGIVKIKGNGQMYSQTYNPDKFWLDGKPQCFDPKMDYSAYSQKDITLPIACGDYGKALIAESKGKKSLL